MITKYDKAIVAVVLGLLAVALPHLGLSTNSSVEDVVKAAVLGAGVFFTPNKQV